MTQCNAGSMESMGVYAHRSGEVLGGEPAHRCTLPKGHEGPHTKMSLMRLGPNAAMRSRYVWADEHELKCLVDVIEVEPDPITPVFQVKNSTSTV